MRNDTFLIKIQQPNLQTEKFLLIKSDILTQKKLFEQNFMC